MNEAILQHLRSLVTLPNDEEEKFISFLKPLHVSKGTYYLREGAVPKKFGLVMQGLFRYLYIDQKGNEYTKNFLPEYHFISSYSAMVAGTPSKLYIEALEDSQVLELSYADWLSLKNGHPGWNLLLIAILEKAFTIKETRERELLLLEARERYALFRSEFPGLEGRISQQMIASYLGISPISLSRLKHQGD